MRYMFLIVMMVMLLVIQGCVDSTLENVKEVQPLRETPCELVENKDWAHYAVGKNLALGKKAMFFPLPVYKLTCKGQTDDFDLTDGKTVPLPADRLWFFKEVVGWLSGTPLYISLDLGKIENIGKVIFRAQSGPQCRFPIGVEILASDDNENWRKVAEAKAVENKRETNEYIIDNSTNKTVIFSIDNINVNARYVCVKLIPGRAFCALDELAVIEGSQKTLPLDSFPVGRVVSNKGAIVEYWDDKIIAPTNIYMPINFKVNHLSLALQGKNVNYKFDVPDYIDIPENNIWGYKRRVQDIPDKGRKVYTFYKKAGTSHREGNFSFFIKAKNGCEGRKDKMKFWAEWEGGKQKQNDLPLETLIVDKPRISNDFIVCSWLSEPYMSIAPEFFKTSRTLGFNGMIYHGKILIDPLFRKSKRDYSEEYRKKIAEARKNGFYIFYQDSPLHRAGDPRYNKGISMDEVYHIGKDGKPKVGRKNICSAYFGKLYQDEMDRITKGVELFDNKIDFVLWDCEVNLSEKYMTQCKRCAEYAKKNNLDWNGFSKNIWVKRHKDFYDAAMKGYKKNGYKNTPVFLEYGCHLNQKREKSLPREGFKELYPKYLGIGNAKMYADGLPEGNLDHAVELILPDCKENDKMPLMPYIDMGGTGYFPAKRVRDLMAFLIGAGCKGVIYWGNRYCQTPVRLMYNHDALDGFRNMTDITLNGNFFNRYDKKKKLHLFGRTKGKEGVAIIYIPHASGKKEIADEFFKDKFVYDLFADKPVSSPEDNSILLDFSDGFWVKAFYFSNDKATFDKKISLRNINKK